MLCDLQNGNTSHLDQVLSNLSAISVTSTIQQPSALISTQSYKTWLAQTGALQEILDCSDVPRTLTRQSRTSRRQPRECTPPSQTFLLVAHATTTAHGMTWSLPPPHVVRPLRGRCCTRWTWRWTPLFCNGKALLAAHGCTLAEEPRLLASRSMPTGVVACQPAAP